MQGPEPAIPLDELTLLVAAHAEPGLDIGRWLGALDDIAARCSDHSFAGLLRHVSVEGFAGNRDDYYDPRNSYLHHVIERRTGIPITLSIVTIELGRRLGVPVVGVGMPGHFLVRDGRDEYSFADPFDGRLLDQDGCERTFAETQPDLSFDVAYLAPVGTLDRGPLAREPEEHPPRSARPSGVGVGARVADRGSRRPVGGAARARVGLGR